MFRVFVMTAGLGLGMALIALRAAVTLGIPDGRSHMRVGGRHAR